MLKSKKSKSLIFVPGYNVSKPVKKALLGLFEINKKIDFDILYVDNVSTDNSVKVVEKLIKNNTKKNVTIIKNKSNLGYGGSQKVAFRYAFKKKYDYLIEYDGDYQYPFEAIPDIYDKILSSNLSMVFGSRITDSKNSKEMPWIKKIGNKTLNIINNWAFDFKVSEIHTGFRAYNLKLLKGFNFENCHDDYRWTLDSVVEVMKINNNFSEIPIACYYHKDASSPSLKDIFKITYYMIKSAINYKIDTKKISK